MILKQCYCVYWQKELQAIIVTEHSAKEYIDDQVGHFPKDMQEEQRALWSIKECSLKEARLLLEVELAIWDQEIQ